TFAGAGSAVASADLNGDGRADLVVANSNSVSVLLGDLPPKVLSIKRISPLGPVTSDNTVNFSVEFNEPVSGVAAGDFGVEHDGVNYSPTLLVNPITPSIYLVTANGVSGSGTLGLDLFDNGSITDMAGSPLEPAFGSPMLSSSGDPLTAPVVADVNHDGLLD